MIQQQKAQKQLRRPKAGGFGEQLGLSFLEQGDIVLAKNLEYLTRKSGKPSKDLIQKVARAHLRVDVEEVEIEEEENFSLFRDIDAAAAKKKAAKEKRFGGR